MDKPLSVTTTLPPDKATEFEATRPAKVKRSAWLRRLALLGLEARKLAEDTRRLDVRGPRAQAAG